MNTITKILLLPISILKKTYMAFSIFCFIALVISCDLDVSEEQEPITEYIKPIPPETPNVLIPVNFNTNQWQVLKYGGSIPSHQVQFLANKMLVTVKSSASPVIYPMTNDPQAIVGISIRGQVDRLVQINSPNRQGEKNFDDFNLRVGLVLLGSTTLESLSWLEKIAIPEWAEKMFNLAPKGQGISHIHFLNAVLSPSLLNKKRTHPLSEYIKEEYTWLMNQPGPFSYSKNFQQPQWTGALWLSVDGDDTKSNFQIEIQEILLTVKKKSQ